ncbi:sensor histidine kinase [Lichenibacterium minor]|uniref:sensor histidine kinase n=1 Tax=Lichenibacterium minor TaxID=2316528 RepID=UPI001FE07EE1|nr:ATP-binding protein [Lichenibacterium minor]
MRHEARFLIDGPAAAVSRRLDLWLAEDLHDVRFAALLDAAGRRVGGNMVGLPRGLPVDGRPRFTPADVLTHDPGGDGRPETLRAAAFRLDDGRILVLGRDLDELDHTRAVILRALLLGLGPMLAVGLGVGAFLGRRALDRVAAVDRVVARVAGGQLGERLPVRGTGDEFDRLARGINLMLDDLERLLGEVRDVGSSVAHDLRTPLTRARLGLERARDAVRDAAGGRRAIDEALAWLDASFAVITAVLRIGEVEHGRRRAGFARVALAPLLREVAELYEPLAEEKGVELALRIEGEADLAADRALLFEAVSNLVDNAVKFSALGRACSIGLVAERGEAVILVEDSGPGIAPAERGLVLKRFYRGEASRSSEGSGLGLALVVAVARLHGFRLTLGDAGPGCRVELRCPAGAVP